MISYEDFFFFIKNATCLTSQNKQLMCLFLCNGFGVFLGGGWNMTVEENQYSSFRCLCSKVAVFINVWRHGVHTDEGMV